MSKSKIQENPEKKVSAVQTVAAGSEVKLTGFEMPNLITVEAAETHIGGTLVAFVDSKRQLETTVEQAGANVYCLREYLPKDRPFDLHIAFLQPK